MNKTASYSKTCVVKIAVFSRCAVFLLQVVFNTLPDHKADAFSPEIKVPNNLADSLCRKVFDGLVKWDSLHFMHLAQHGYTSEQSFAFFPLFPFTVRLLSLAVLQCFPCLSLYTCCLLSAVVLNFFLFTGATAHLYDMTLYIFKSAKFAFITCTLFCINPASIFFSSCYSESMFAFFAFKALSLMWTRNSQTSIVQLQSSICFMFASLTRSNGSVNCGFIIYYFISHLAKRYFTTTVSLFFMFRVSLWALFLNILIFSPIFMFNVYGYFHFCFYPAKETSIDNVTCFIAPSWCSAPVPSIYNHVQAHHWGLGLFAYYKFAKIPNFFLASPVVTLSFYSLYLYFIQQRRNIFHLGLLSDEKRIISKFEFASRNIFPFLFHLLFLVVFALMYMHIEVSTRLIFSSTPVLYWSVASFITCDLNAAKVQVFSFTVWPSLSIKSKICVSYFLSYFVIGVLLHSNFLPWT